MKLNVNNPPFTVLLLAASWLMINDSAPTFVSGLVPQSCPSPMAAASRASTTTRIFSSAAANPSDLTTENQQTSATSISSVSDWHRQRRREMLEKYGDQIAPLERQASSQAVGIPLSAVVCGGLWGLALLSGSLPLPAVVLLALFPGSMLSLWQLQILHDVIHGSFFEKGQTKITVPLIGTTMTRQKAQDALLFWGSLPCFFGYYLYLKVGHLSHHSNTGEHSLAEVFASDQVDFEDGDMLFVAHRMHLTGDYGPKIPLPADNELKMSISKSGFYFWEAGESTRNAILFASSFLFERVMLGFNDAAVALTGTNFFFPNKPSAFQEDCTKYARVATALRAALWLSVGWKSLLFLYLSESLWSLPPHPACAMFVTNHGSNMDDNNGCVPTRSTYSGAWYTLLTLGTNLHCEHHDFPTIPFNKLHKLREIAPEYYRQGSDDDILSIMKSTFAEPEFYACMNANEMLADPTSPGRSTTGS